MPGLQFFDSKECEWADMEVQIEGAPLQKLRGIRYKESQDKALLYAAGNKPLSIQKGNKAYEGEIKMLKGAVDILNSAAIAAGGDSILDLEFQVNITYKAKGTRPLQRTVLINVQVKDIERGWDQGADHMEISLPILFVDMKQA